MTGPGLDGPAVTIARAAELLSCSRARVFELLRDGRIVRAPRFGRRTTVTTASVLAALGPAPAPKPRRAARHKSALAEAAAIRSIPIVRL